MMTLAFLGKFAACVVILGNLVLVLWLGIPRLRAWLTHRRHVKNMALLKNSPHALKQIIKDRDRLIAWFEDRELEMKAELARADWREKELTAEIKRLTGRNVMMANELRVDMSADTQVMRPSRSARWG